eukprot:g11068.t3
MPPRWPGLQLLKSAHNTGQPQRERASDTQLVKEGAEVAEDPIHQEPQRPALSISASRLRQLTRPRPKGAPSQGAPSQGQGPNQPGTGSASGSSSKHEGKGGKGGKAGKGKTKAKNPPKITQILEVLKARRAEAEQAKLTRKQEEAAKAGKAPAARAPKAQAAQVPAKAPAVPAAPAAAPRAPKASAAPIVPKKSAPAAPAPENESILAKRSVELENRDLACKAICRIKRGLREARRRDDGRPFIPEDWETTFKPFLGSYIRFLLSRPDQFKVHQGMGPGLYSIEDVTNNEAMMPNQLAPGKGGKSWISAKAKAHVKGGSKAGCSLGAKGGSKGSKGRSKVGSKGADVSPASGTSKAVAIGTAGDADKVTEEAAFAALEQAFEEVDEPLPSRKRTSLIAELFSEEPLGPLGTMVMEASVMELPVSFVSVELAIGFVHEQQAERPVQAQGIGREQGSTADRSWSTRTRTMRAASGFGLQNPCSARGAPFRVPRCSELLEDREVAWPVPLAMPFMQSWQAVPVEHAHEESGPVLEERRRPLAWRSLWRFRPQRRAVALNASVLVLHLAPDLQVEALKKLIKNALEVRKQPQQLETFLRVVQASGYNLLDLDKDDWREIGGDLHPFLLPLATKGSFDDDLEVLGLLVRAPNGKELSPDEWQVVRQKPRKSKVVELLADDVGRYIVKRAEEANFQKKKQDLQIIEATKDVYDVRFKGGCVSGCVQTFGHGTHQQRRCNDWAGHR